MMATTTTTTTTAAAAAATQAAKATPVSATMHFLNLILDGQREAQSDSNMELAGNWPAKAQLALQAAFNVKL